MKQCDGNHPSGFVFAERETMRLSFKLGPRNAEASRRGHVSMVIMQWATEQALRYYRIPLLDTLEVSFTQDLGGQDRVDATLTVEYYGDGAREAWLCPARGIEAARVNNILTGGPIPSYDDGRMLN
jgi:hypothetical protein